MVMVNLLKHLIEPKLSHRDKSILDKKD